MWQNECRRRLQSSLKISEVVTRYKQCRHTFLVFWETPVVVPPRYEDHVVSKILSLDFGFLKDDNVGLEDVKHGIKRSFVSPWLVSERIADAIDIPGGDSNPHCWLGSPPPHRNSDEEEGG